MIGSIGKLGDRVLERLVPKATAQADTSWTERCYCISERRARFRTCHVVGGTSGCTPCNIERIVNCF
ncbi:hypothetical protein AB0M39_29935 [Streptomyces sp. NPDC051907]|uniref:hypothetical protein n=1 Tax=Streptomyces sp. NPDC051907 TaxID=3155284 RepID=UPI003427364B